MWLAPGLTLLHQSVSNDGLHRLAIFERSDGRFGYAGEKLTTEDGQTFWRPCDLSGIHETAEAAEQNARLEVPWFRHENHS